VSPAVRWGLVEPVREPARGGGADGALLASAGRPGPAPSRPVLAISDDVRLGENTWSFNSPGRRP